MQRHYLQEEEWATTRAETDWQYSEIAGITVYHRNVPVLGKIGYAPLCPPLTDETIAAIKTECSDFFMVRVEPEQKTTDADEIKSSGLVKPSKGKIQYQSTVEIDLNQTEDDIINSFDKGMRYNIRKAAKRGVVVTEIEPTQENFAKLYDFKIVTSDRSGHYLRPKKFLLAFWGRLAANNAALLQEVTHEGEVVAMGLSAYKNDRAWNIATGSLRTKRSLAAPALMHWEMMKKLREKGVKHYDLTGISPPKIRANKDQAMSGVDSFKVGFGEQYIKDYVGVYDVVINKQKYKFWTRFESLFVRLYAKVTNRYWW